MRLLDTIRLMQVIGQPHTRVSASERFADYLLDERALLNLLPLAIRNKVPLLFLEKAEMSCKNSRHLTHMYQTYLEKWKLTLELMKDISRTLAEYDADYAIFKTIEPFPFVKSDIDILFFAHEDFVKSCHTLQRRNFKFLGSGPYSITLHSVKHETNIDLQLEISVSRLVYLDKSILQKHVTEINIDGYAIPVLEPPASLITIISHSFYKEQILTLSNYYTAVMEILAMNKLQRRTICILSEKLDVDLSTKLILEFVQALTVTAFKKHIQPVAEITQSISINGMEATARQISHGGFDKCKELPYKYQPISIALAFASKLLKDPLMRQTMSSQLLNSISEAPDLILSILRHLKRETY